jgi:hypothetical protein
VSKIKYPYPLQNLPHQIISLLIPIIFIRERIRFLPARPLPCYLPEMINTAGFFLITGKNFTDTGTELQRELLTGVEKGTKGVTYWKNKQ